MIRSSAAVAVAVCSFMFLGICLASGRLPAPEPSPPQMTISTDRTTIASGDGVRLQLVLFSGPWTPQPGYVATCDDSSQFVIGWTQVVSVGSSTPGSGIAIVDSRTGYSSDTLSYYTNCAKHY